MAATHDELRALAQRHLDAGAADQWVSLLQPAAALVHHRSPDGAVGCLGGRPPLPADFAWPVWPGEGPLAHIATIDLGAVARTVPGGVAIAAEDLTVLRMSAEPRLRMIPASAQERVVGRTANAALVAGTVLTESHFGERGGPRSGESIVAVALKGPRGAPPSIRTGDRVQMVLLALESDAARNDGGGPQRLGSVLGEGRVLSVDRPRSSADNSATVSVIVGDALAPTVAGAAAAERVSLVVVERGA